MIHYAWTNGRTLCGRGVDLNNDMRTCEHCLTRSEGAGLRYVVAVKRDDGTMQVAAETDIYLVARAAVEVLDGREVEVFDRLHGRIIEINTEDL